MKVFAYLSVFWLSCIIKLFCIRLYRSTDFEVHRNWLAITHSLPVGHWYYESTSEWTLDYPPFFAWFEWLLSQAAAFVDPGMLDISNLNYASDATIVFQRFSVIIADLALVAGLVVYVTARDEHTFERVDPALEPATAAPAVRPSRSSSARIRAASPSAEGPAEPTQSLSRKNEIVKAIAIANAKKFSAAAPETPAAGTTAVPAHANDAASVSAVDAGASAAAATEDLWWWSGELQGPSPMCCPLRSSTPPLRAPRVSKPLIVFALVLLHPCLLLVDHIHFQYNGFLIGMLIASLGMHRRGCDLAGAALFAALLNFKHIFLYVAPAYFVYLLAKYCFVANVEAVPDAPGRGRAATKPGVSCPPAAPRRARFSLARFCALGAVVAAVTAVSLVPVLIATPPPAHAYAEALRLGLVAAPDPAEPTPAAPQLHAPRVASAATSATGGAPPLVVPAVSLPLGARVALNGRQLVSRLFPFRRGLTHAYWAPNVWALYNALDRVLAGAGRAARGALSRAGLGAPLGVGAPAAVPSATEVPRVSPTSGLVQDVSHVALPSVSPLATALLTFIAMLPALLVLWRSPAPRVFAATVVYCSLCSFMLGWHVHEKAILLSLLPMALACLDSEQQTRTYMLLSPAATLSVLPLVTIHPPTVPAALALIAVFTVLQHTLIDQEGMQIAGARRFRYRGINHILRRSEQVYLAGLPAVFASWYALAALLPALPFLPLMLTSCYCAVGFVAVWLLQLQDLYGLEVLIHSYGAAAPLPAHAAAEPVDAAAAPAAVVAVGTAAAALASSLSSGKSADFSAGSGTGAKARRPPASVPSIDSEEKEEEEAEENEANEKISRKIVNNSNGTSLRSRRSRVA
jgi:hypothetical protein